MGKTDSNIGNGIPCEDAVDQLTRAMYLKRNWICLANDYYFTIWPRSQLLLGENFVKFWMYRDYQKQIQAKKAAK